MSNMSNMSNIDALIKKLEEAKEELSKAAKDNALHRLFRDLAPHVDSATLGNLKQDKDGLSHSNQPHKDGLVSFDIQHHPGKKDIVNKILEQHGHFRHPSSFGEDMSIDADQHHQYGAIQLHPERAKFLKEGPSLSADVKPGQNLINEQSIGSQNLMEGSNTGEGNVKPAKWQGSDPRKFNNYEQTRAGNASAIPAQGSYDANAKKPMRAAVAGVSPKGYERVETGKPIKKSNNDQWSFEEELSKGVNCAPGAQQNTLAKDAANPALAPKQVKVKQLQAQIDSGTYKPDPKKIADKMLKEELTCSENGQWKLMEKSVYNVGVSQAKLKGREAKSGNAFPHYDYNHDISHEDNTKQAKAHFDKHKISMNDSRLSTYLSQAKEK